VTSYRALCELKLAIESKSKIRTRRFTRRLGRAPINYHGIESLVLRCVERADADTACLWLFWRKIWESSVITGVQRANFKFTLHCSTLPSTHYTGTGCLNISDQHQLLKIHKVILAAFYMVRAAKHPLTLIAIFSATACNFSAKFHTLITCLYVRTYANLHLILSYCSKVTDFFCETTSWFCRL